MRGMYRARGRPARECVPHACRHGRQRPGQQGDPGAALDFYAKANDSAKALLDSASVTQAQLDAYQAQVGGVASILSKQVAINAAIGESCPRIG